MGTTWGMRAQVRDLAGAGVVQAACGAAHTLFLCRWGPTRACHKTCLQRHILTPAVSGLEKGVLLDKYKVGVIHMSDVVVGKMA